MDDKKTPDEESVSGGMTQGEAMQRVIALRKASGAPAAPMNVAAAPPQRSETLHERMKRRHPGLTDKKIDDLLALIGS